MILMLKTNIYIIKINLESNFHSNEEKKSDEESENFSLSNSFSVKRDYELCNNIFYNSNEINYELGENKNISILGTNLEEDTKSNAKNNINDKDNQDFMNQKPIKRKKMYPYDDSDNDSINKKRNSGGKKNGQIQ